jgi:hypothetical protein
MATSRSLIVLFLNGEKLMFNLIVLNNKTKLSFSRQPGYLKRPVAFRPRLQASLALSSRLLYFIISKKQ